MIADRIVTLEDERALRDPETGILVGMEPLELGPEASSLGVLFVHGFLGGSSNFADLPESVAAKGLHVRAMLLPGHGTSPRVFENTTVDELLEAVTKEIVAMRAKHEKVILVTHSMGSTLSVLAAVGNEVDGIVLGAPYFGVTSRWYYVLKPETWTRISSSFVRWVFKGKIFLQVNKPEAKEDVITYKWVPTKSILTLTEIAERANNQEVLSAITCPVLMIHSKGDVAADPDAAERAFENLGSEQKKVVWLKTSNHVIFWDYERDLVKKEILGFIEKLS